MGEVGSVRYEPALLPPCPSIRVLSSSILSKIQPLHISMNVQKFSTLRVNKYSQEVGGILLREREREGEREGEREREREKGGDD